MATPYITVGNDTSRTPPEPGSSPQAWEIYALTQGDKAALGALAATLRKTQINRKWHLVLHESTGEGDKVITMTVRLIHATQNSILSPFAYRGSSMISIGDQEEAALVCDNTDLNYSKWQEFGRECHLATTGERGLAWRRFLARLWCFAFPNVPIDHGFATGDAEDAPDPTPSTPPRKRRTNDSQLLSGEGSKGAAAKGVEVTPISRKRAKEGRDKSSASELKGVDDDDDHVKGEVEGGASVMAAMTEAVEKAVNVSLTGAASGDGGDALGERGARAFWLLYDRDGKFEWKGKRRHLDLDNEDVAKMVAQGFDEDTKSRHVTLPPIDVLKEARTWFREVKPCVSCSEAYPFVSWYRRLLGGGGANIRVKHHDPEVGRAKLTAMKKERVEKAARKQVAEQAGRLAEQIVAKHTHLEDDKRGDSASAQSEGTGRAVGAASSPSEEKPQVVDVASRPRGEMGNIWCIPSAASRIVASLLPLILETRKLRDSEYSSKR
ncbi:hypothetical protein LTR53_002374 [Teratosphaeriaceae sp. CCFEE 6253]|nr:hypothetical protein LTR53_002374 [Teratosphaeriaceae sp. CCFEE 6253]